MAIATPSDLDEWQEASLLGNFEQDVEEEEEALSLCDLPIEFVKEEDRTHNHHQAHKPDEEFDFGLRARSLSTVEHRISAADELFFKGQILPLRHSVSSEGRGIPSGEAYKDGSSSMISRDISRCKSMDDSSIGRFTSVGSRSSSIGSHHSSSSSTVTSTTNTSSLVSIISSGRTRDGTARNRFHGYPSPKPQIRMSSNNLGNVPSRTPKSSVWELFRIGLVRTPDIELQLQDLKHRTNGKISKRCSVSRNSSTSSSSQTNPSPKKSGQIEHKQNGFRRRGFFNGSSGSFLGGCRCSVGTVTVPSNISAMKSSERQNREVDETRQEWKMTMKMKKKMEIKQKQAMSRHRTFEWLKELSHGGFPQEL